MNGFDTFKATIELTFTKPATDEPTVAAIDYTDMFFEQPAELVQMLREGIEDDSILLVVTHEATDEEVVTDAEVAKIEQEFGVNGDDEWG